MLQALSPSNNRPVPQQIMTLGLDRKAASSDRRASLTSKYNSVQAKKPSSEAADSPQITMGKPKTVLTSKCTELKYSGLNIIHSVQLLLTSYREVLVLKKGDKSRHETVLRRHSVLTDSFSEHHILPCALLVEVPHTLLRYVYQFEKEKTLKQWVDKISACRKEVQDAERQHGAELCAKNGLITNHSVATTELGSSLEIIPARRSLKLKGTGKSSDKSTGISYTQAPYNPEPQFRLQSFIQSLSPESKKSGSFKVPSELSDDYTQDPCSPEFKLQSLIQSPGSNKLEFVSCGSLKGLSTTSESSATASYTQGPEFRVHSLTESPRRSEFASTCSRNCPSTTPQSSAGDASAQGPCSPEFKVQSLIQSPGGKKSAFASSGSWKAPSTIATSETTNISSSFDSVQEEPNICSPTMVVTEAEELPSTSLASGHQQMGKRDSGSDDNPATSSPVFLSRNSSARSSNKSLGAGSARSLNLAVLQESLELSECSHQKDARRHSSSNVHMAWNLPEKRSNFVRRASDQLVGLLKMSSFREKEKRKMNYVRMSASVSELDSMLTSDQDLDFLCLPRRPPSRRSNHTPTTPTSPLANSRVLSPSSSPTSAPGEGGEGEGEKPEEFVVSRFHHTQIRNQKRKQSPRIRRNLSTSNEKGGAGERKQGRSTSESPTASAVRSLYQRMEGRLVIRM